MAILTERVASRGPIVPVALNVSEDFATRRKQAGLPAVRPHACEALLDTGATRSLVDPAAIAALGVEPLGEVDLATASTGAQRKVCRAFVVRVSVTVAGKTIAMTLNVIESDLDVPVVLGRDFLSRCLLVYNGPSGEFTLSY